MTGWHGNLLTREPAEPEPIAALDELTLAELFDLWLIAAVESSIALSAWITAGWAEKGDAHAAYRASLDREQHAAAVIARRVPSR